MVTKLNDRQSNKSVIYTSELSIPTGEVLILDFDKLSNGAYAIGIPFFNVELQNLGNSAGAEVENLVLYYNQADNQSQKIRKNFVFEKSDQEIRSLKIANMGAGTATFDLRLDNKDTILDIAKQIRNKYLKVVEDNRGIARS